MKKLKLILSLLVLSIYTAFTLSCTAPEQTVDNSKNSTNSTSNGVITVTNYPPPVLHIPTWLQGKYYRTNALGGTPQSSDYRLYITDTEIRTEFDRTTISPFDPPVYELVKTPYTSYLGNYYIKVQELYGTDIFGEYYELYGDERNSNKKTVLIYKFWRQPSVANAMCWWFPRMGYWIKF